MKDRPSVSLGLGERARSLASSFAEMKLAHRTRFFHHSRPRPFLRSADRHTRILLRVFPEGLSFHEGWLLRSFRRITLFSEKRKEKFSISCFHSAVAVIYENSLSLQVLQKQMDLELELHGDLKEKTSNAADRNAGGGGGSGSGGGSGGGGGGGGIGGLGSSSVAIGKVYMLSLSSQPVDHEDASGITKVREYEFAMKL